MKRFLLLLLLPLLLCAEWEEFFSEDEDPTLFHHVNVISGNLNLAFQDTIVQGPRPMSLVRSYSSAGALERTPDNVDLAIKKICGGFVLQGGWNFFPHTKMIVEWAEQFKNWKVYIAEPSGLMVTYVFSHELSDACFVLKPRAQNTQTLSARTNPQNNTLCIDTKYWDATLYLPDGGERYYKCKKPKGTRQFALDLIKERLPSGHRQLYGYDDHRLTEVSLINPAETRSLGKINFTLHRTSPPFDIHIKTSDGQWFDYHAVAFADRDYLNRIEGTSSRGEELHYDPGRRGIGLRIKKMSRAGKLQFTAEYIGPGEHEKYVAKHPAEKHWRVDKVFRIDAPIGPGEGNLPLGQFFYDTPNLTSVRDSEYKLIQYHHADGHLLEIVHFGENDQVARSQKFLWDGSRLKGKVLIDPSGQAHLAKTFQYDDPGNVTQEILYGNLTGEGPETFSADSLQEAESFCKRYEYSNGFNLLTLEEEEGGLTYRYHYKEGTDLLTAKYTCDKDFVLKRELFAYDAEHLLIEEIVDDGENGTQRLIKRYELNAEGMPGTITESFWDFAAGKEVVLKKTKCSYANKLVIAEEVYDANETYRYTLHTTYDAERRVRHKTNALGQDNFYEYDTDWNLCQIKEVGSPRKIYTFDRASRQRSCTENDKITYNTYDLKGRLLTQTDSKGNTTTQSYDCFGHCLKTEFSPSQDETGQSYTPITHFTYDIQGNLASSTMPQGESTRTTFNALRKPLLIIYPDGSETRHFYHKNGTLCKTIHPDQTEEHYTHDLFARMTSHHIYAADKTLLSSESWVYSTFQLLSYTDYRGLTIHYTYDGAGRKIAERAADRQKRYTYDALGFLEQSIEEDVYHMELHDVLGRVTKKWVEQDDLRENYMHFFYDAENRKEKAIRLTSQGEATDLFFYDIEGRLTRHIDPLDSVTAFAYEEVRNDLGQWVLQKTTRDPLGNASIETYDATNRLTLCEKKDPSGNTVSKEKLFYDRSGNKSTQEITVYENSSTGGFQPLKTITNRWEYNVLSQVVREIEAGQKITEYEYDSRGHISKRILPSGITLFYAYDGIDRLSELKSSDGSVHYMYFYQQGPEPVEIQDLVHNNTLKRSYNLFGQVISETNPYGLTSQWEYDESGRCMLFTLPDHSSISYVYYGLHVRSVSRWSLSNQPLYEHAYTQFDVNGHVAKETLIHGQSVTSTHDLLERPHTQVSPWLMQSVSYGPSSLVAEVTNSLLGNKTYAYDALNQLTQEGEQRFDFNTIGNSTAHETNDLNQILHTPEEALSYDADGNPQERLSADKHIQYRYDALGRLTSITTSGSTVYFAYDPLSRLLSKTTDTTRLYLYDQDREIGTCTTSGSVLQLKVLGLGLKGDIGASVALELNGQTYAPLHDFGGNIIALIDAQNQLAETYQIDAFGKEINLSTPPISPWRFCSKRAEEGLVFFGIRFYDPSLGRWLTPDPAGFADGPNLYLYVLNSPLNRLDLFGLMGEFSFEPKGCLEFPMWTSATPPIQINNWLCGKVTVGKWKVDFLVLAEQVHKLTFTPEETQEGKIHILQRFIDPSAKKGTIGLISMQNGINTTLEECAANCQTLADQRPGVPIIGIYNPTIGVPADGFRAVREFFGAETRGVKSTRQIFSAIIENISKINPDCKWEHVTHSEGGAISHNAMRGLPKTQREFLQTNLISLNFGPLKPIPRAFALQAVNFYSRADGITGLSGLAHSFRSKKYDIQFISSKTPFKERTMYLFDHTFLGKTYQGALEEGVRGLSRDFGFVYGETR